MTSKPRTDAKHSIKVDKYVATTQPLRRKRAHQNHRRPNFPLKIFTSFVNDPLKELEFFKSHTLVLRVTNGFT